MSGQLLSSTVELGITTAMLEPLVDYITGNIAVIMPIGITVFGIIVGIGMIPKIIKKFTSA